MNFFEKAIYDVVKANPKLKAGVVSLYQSMFALVPFARLQSISPVIVRDGYFFGFHDKCPWSAGNEYLLSHRILTGNRVVRRGDEVEVGFFSGDNWQHFNVVSRTQSWDWQLGAMLQWISQNQLLFNVYEEGHYQAKICNIVNSETRILKRPIVAVSSDGKNGISYDFDRLHVAMPGYGYVCRGANQRWTDNDYPDSGSLYSVDLVSGNSRRLFTIDDIRNVTPEPSMDNAFHFFHHPLFCPGSKRFVFFHRWVRNWNQRFTRMFSCALDGSDLYCFPTDGMVSHIGWKDASHILAYARVEGEDGYYLFKDRSDSLTRIGQESFNSDGHPQYSPEELLLIDTYPDRYRMQYLAVYDVEKRSRKNIVRTRLPSKFRKQLKVDLHPRWSRDGSSVCFDSGHTGVRSLCTMQLPKDYKTCVLR
ncbi:hypothetical protein N9004_00435 [Pirellulales bacterium]|nr:hypothetical protein [Pirellulales bacterium]